MLFFGACSYWIVKRFFEDKIGLRIDEQGIIDKSHGTGIGLIEWNDITGIETFKVHSTKFLILFTDQPKKYINRATNGIMKKTLQANNRMCGSPIAINSNSLKIGHRELELLITENWEKWGKKDALQQAL
ncbi:STM3941 family protein [Roseivirga thermotolerans]|uniref:STM3941 family protein n=1 Tax=Roseivirga thermotolerans TaxID=1758176 RepID=UPI00273FDF71|nr:STM3941 family protein [Roseivirga thermotolerans]